MRKNRWRRTSTGDAFGGSSVEASAMPFFHAEKAPSAFATGEGPQAGGCAATGNMQVSGAAVGQGYRGRGEFNKHAQFLLRSSSDTWQELLFQIPDCSASMLRDRGNGEPGTHDARGGSNADSPRTPSVLEHQDSNSEASTATSLPSTRRINFGVLLAADGSPLAPFPLSARNASMLLVHGLLRHLSPPQFWGSVAVLPAELQAHVFCSLADASRLEDRPFLRFRAALCAAGICLRTQQDAVRAFRDAHDRLGGCMFIRAEVHACLPTVLDYLRSALDCLQLQQVHLSLRRVLIDAQLPSHVVVDMSQLPCTAFRDCRAVQKFLQGSNSGAAALIPHKVLDLCLGAERVCLLDWSGVYVHRLMEASAWNVVSWRSRHPALRSCKLRVTFPAPPFRVVFGVKNRKQDSDVQFREWIMLQETREDGLLLTHRGALDVPFILRGSMASAQQEVVLKWDDWLEVSVGDEPLPGLALRQAANPWSFVYVSCVRRPEVGKFAVVPIPAALCADCPMPLRHLCPRVWPAVSHACCQLCETWFCCRHGFSSVRTCVGCAPDTWWEDHVGGAATDVPRAVNVNRCSSAAQTCPCDLAAASLQDCSGGAFSASEHVQEFDRDKMSLQQKRTVAQMIRGNGVPACCVTRPPVGSVSLFQQGLQCHLPSCLRSSKYPRAMQCDLRYLSYDSLPPPVLDLLSVVHPHERDQCLSFDAETHTYAWHGAPTLGSVTGLVKRCSQPFHALQTIKAMRESSRWPRQGYLKKYMPLSLLAQVRSLPDASALLAALSELPLSETKVVAACSDFVSVHPAYYYIKDLISLTDQEILDMWETNRRMAAAQGTCMHASIECILNAGCVRPSTPELEKLFAFLREFLRAKMLTIHRTEWKVFAEEENLAGSIDCVAKTPEGTLVLLDWKRTNNLAAKCSSFGRSMTWPVEDLPDSVLQHYELQLNIYAWMLERYYAASVSAMFVVGLRPDFATFVHEVPRLQRATKNLMVWQCSRASAPVDAFGGSASSQLDEAAFLRQLQAEIEEQNAETLTEASPRDASAQQLGDPFNPPVLQHVSQPPGHDLSGVPSSSHQVAAESAEVEDAEIVRELASQMEEQMPPAEAPLGLESCKKDASWPAQRNPARSFR